MTLSDRPPLQPFVDKLVARSGLGPAEQQALLTLPAQSVQVPANHDFVRLGERVDHACFVLAGLVGRFGQSKAGNRQITAVHLPTDMVDLHSVVVPDASSALQALSVTTILRIPHRVLRALAHAYPAIAEAFWRECVVDAAVLSEWVLNIGRRDAKARVGHLLCEIACRVEGAGEKVGSVVPFPATQTHIADMAGLTPVHVNRTLRELRDAKIVEIRTRTIHILDWPRLIAVGDFDPAYLHLPKAAGA
jgi:CRP-like cAMP-binding protein